MKVMTVLGTRPEIIRLSRIIPLLDRHTDHVFVHTGQNFDPNLSDIFLQQLRLREPDHVLHVRASSLGVQIAQILTRIEELLVTCRPDRVLLLGDTNSALAAIIAKRLAIPVYHLEAGNRCYDDRVPEEINRRIVDHTSDILMPYTERSRANLLREGVRSDRIFVVGNPIHEVMTYYRPEIDGSQILAQLGLKERSYFLVTAHRAENVDVPERLQSISRCLASVAEEYKFPIVCSVHPRMRSKMAAASSDQLSNFVVYHEPFGFFDFVALERAAYCVLSDSGTVQEECCLLRVPNVTLRDVTERPETVECGSNILSGVDASAVRRAVAIAVSGGQTWIPPKEYLTPDVSATVLNIVAGR